MNKKIFVTRRIPDIGLSMLKEKGYEVDIYPKDKIASQKELIGYLKQKPYDGVLSLLTSKIDSAVFDAVPTAKIFANYASGFDNLDLAEAKKRGITVTNAPSDLASEAVALHAVAAMLALAGRLVEADDFVRAGKYKGWDPMMFIGMDVRGKILGLIGAGRIGRDAAHFSKGLGLSIIYTDVVRNEAFEKECGATYYSTADEVLSLADVVSLHVPLFDSTHHLINKARLKLMKPTAYLINTSRGPIIDENALVQALKEKKLAGAALDVFEFEPKLAKGLAKLPNVILTPHIASASAEARDGMATIAATNIIDFFEGRTPKYVVNK